MFIDCDANATYGPGEEIQGVIADLLGRLGNPSSLHRGGQRARAVIEEAREAVQQLVGAERDDRVVFTSGASEANNMVIASAVQAGGGIVTSTIEHPCVLAPCAAVAASPHAHEGRGDVQYVSPTTGGRVEPSMVFEKVRPTSRLISVMAANNETGVINDIAAISSAVRGCAAGAWLHTDAAQCLGKIPLSFRDAGVDLMTVSGHKVGALTGVGALIIREGCDLHALILGGPQEGKLRGGTENVLGIGVFGAVARRLLEAGSGALAARSAAMCRVRDAFEAELKERVSGIAINGALEDRLPNTSSVYIPGVRADDLVVALDCDGILISSGAACSSGKPEPSHVLLAMGQPEERVRSTIRVSFRGDSEPGVATVVVDALVRCVERMRGIGLISDAVRG